MKKRSICAIIAAAMSAVMIMLPPMQVMAAAQETEKVEYIRDIRLGIGKDVETAADMLHGYNILKNGDKYADLNQKAGGGMGSKGEMAVVLGYSTTTRKSEAVTDIALMNMKGGYSVKDYEFLMEQHMKEQIIPLVTGLQKAIEEYRYNYTNGSKENKQRAEFIHDALNKLTDNDTGKPLGDLLLNKTKFELGDEAYNKLSDKEKKEHADIITIIAQANGKATLMIENLITRAADTEESTWLERFAETTYDNMIDSSGMSTSEAKTEIARLYDDDAQTIANMWDELRNFLAGYDDAVKTIKNYDEKSVKETMSKYENAAKTTFKGYTKEQIEELADEYAAASKALNDMTNALQLVALHDQLEAIEYLDSNMYDFFARNIDEVETEELYPLAASFSDGQRAGLEFISLRELITIALTTAEGYKDADLSTMRDTSIYAGVDRSIYEKGGIALTSDADRKKAALNDQDDSMFSALSISLMALTGVSFAAFVTSSVLFLKTYITELKPVVDLCKEEALIAKMHSGRDYVWQDFIQAVDRRGGGLPSYSTALSHTGLYAKLAFGFSVAMIILAGVTTYLSWQDMKAYYNVKYSPIPNYIVDAKDITAYNTKGERIVIKNREAYYEVTGAISNLYSDYYKNFGDSPDLNGGVGKQWLAVYVERNQNAAPIIADSLLTVIDSTDLPAGYTTGIHMFGSDSAFNLNDAKYVYNSDAPKVFVYYNVDDKAVSTSAGANANNGASNNTVTGSVYTSGYLFLAGGIGLLLGAGIVALIIFAAKPKKKEENNS